MSDAKTGGSDAGGEERDAESSDDEVTHDEVTPAEAPIDAERGTGRGVPPDWTIPRIVRTMIPLLAALSVLQMVSGTVLETYEEALLENPALLILVPVQIGTAGNLASIMCSRLSTGIHLGTFELSPSNPAVRANVGAVFALAATVFSAVGIAAWAIGTLLGGTLGLVEVLTVSLLSGMALAVLVVVLSLFAVQASYRIGLNPDDTTIPIVTNLCDVGGVLVLFAIVAVVL